MCNMMHKCECATGWCLNKEPNRKCVSLIADVQKRIITDMEYNAERLKDCNTVLLNVAKKVENRR